MIKVLLLIEHFYCLLSKQPGRAKDAIDKMRSQPTPILGGLLGGGLLLALPIAAALIVSFVQKRRASRARESATSAAQAPVPVELAEVQPDSRKPSSSSL